MSNKSPFESLGASARWGSWQIQLAELGGPNPLLHFESNTLNHIDLTRAHPSGIAQFISTGQVKLSNLVRDPLALSRANIAAKRIHRKAKELSVGFGVESIYLAGGLASLKSEGFDLSLPILLWQISLTESSDDFLLSRVSAPQVNPELAAVFENQFDVQIDQAKLLANLDVATDLVPMSVLEYLSDLGSDAKNLELKRVLAIGNFVTEIGVNSRLQAYRPSIVDSLASEVQATQKTELRPVLPFLALDSIEERIIARALAGESFAVETLPGCGYTQTVATLLANFAFDGKRVLLVANRMQTVNEVMQRLQDASLAGVIVRTSSTWLDVVAGISRNEKAKPDNFAEVQLLSQIAGETYSAYLEHLTHRVAKLDVTLIDCMQKLVELAAMPHAPVAEAEIPGESILPRDSYDEQLQSLRKLEELRVFQEGNNPWFGARFESQSQLEEAKKIANRLRNESFPRLSSKLAEFISQSEFQVATSVAQWGEYLRLFVGLRETLDRLTPQVFDRPIDDLIKATAARKEKADMTGRTRRRLRKLAREFVRPGVSVVDINALLLAAKNQREAWQRFAQSLKPPTVPYGINDALVSYQALVDDLHLLQQHVQLAQLEQLPLEELKLTLDAMCDSTSPLDQYFEKRALIDGLGSLGLGDVIVNFAKLGIRGENLAVEFDQVWWKSALKQALAEVPDFMSFDRNRLSSLEAQIEELSHQLVKSAQAKLRNELSVRWTEALKANVKQVELFRSLLKSGHASLADLLSVAPDLMAAVSPVIASPALQVESQLLVDTTFDVIVILDAAGSTVGENLAGLLRSEQVVCFGDEVIAAATGFQVEPGDPIELSQLSAFREIADRYGVEVLRRSYREEGQLLGSLINRDFYQNRLALISSKNDFFGRSRVKVNILTAGEKAPDTNEGSNESLDAEVIKTVELVLNHAAWNPQDSLLVASASAKHAERVRSSLAQSLKSRPDLQAWFEAHGDEMFEIETISGLRHRVADRIIFSVGFGKSLRGAVLTSFGDLSRPDGRRALANMLVSARKELHIVSCLSASDLPDAGLSGGAIELKQLLLAANEPYQGMVELDSDHLIDDLAIRMRKLGVTVKSGFSNELPLIASYGDQAKVLIPDWRNLEQDLLEKLGILPNFLRTLGWQPERLNAFELFADPGSVAQRIAAGLGIGVINEIDSGIDELWLQEKNDFENRTGRDSNDGRLKSEKPPHWS